MSPKVTIVLGSARPGGLDISLAGLAAQTFTDFEVIFGDARYHSRHERVLDAVERSGLKQPFYHVPNHRYSDGPWGTACAGYNSTFALAAGETIVMLLDYAYARPDWLERHVEHAGKLVMSPHEYRTLTGARTVHGTPAIEFNRQFVEQLVADRYCGLECAARVIQSFRELYDEVSCWPKPFTAEDLDVYPVENVSIPENIATGGSEPYFFSTKNESFPREAIYAVNGMREEADCGRMPADPELGYRLMWSGLEPWVCREAMVHCINPRTILPNLNLIAPESGPMPPPYDKRITVEHGNAVYNKLRAEQEPWAENPVPLAELRERIWHWRALSQERDAVIPRVVTPDEAYFGAMKVRYA